MSFSLRATSERRSGLRKESGPDFLKIFFADLLYNLAMDVRLTPSEVAA
jgi:hypothetical protein